MSAFLHNYFELAAGVSRPYTITGGLLEGYDRITGRVHPLHDVIKAHHAWQAEKRVILEMAAREITLSYGSLKPDGVWSCQEPGFIASGSINVLYDSHLTEGEALDRVLSLATYLAKALNQVRIYVVYGGRDYILQRDSENPDAEFHYPPRETHGGGL